MSYLYGKRAIIRLCDDTRHNTCMDCAEILVQSYSRCHMCRARYPEDICERIEELKEMRARIICDVQEERERMKREEKENKELLNRFKIQKYKKHRADYVKFRSAYKKVRRLRSQQKIPPSRRA